MVIYSNQVIGDVLTNFSDIPYTLSERTDIWIKHCYICVISKVKSENFVDLLRFHWLFDRLHGDLIKAIKN